MNKLFDFWDKIKKWFMTKHTIALNINLIKNIFPYLGCFLIGGVLYQLTHLFIISMFPFFSWSQVINDSILYFWIYAILIIIIKLFQPDINENNWINYSNFDIIIGSWLGWFIFRISRVIFKDQFNLNILIIISLWASIFLIVLNRKENFFFIFNFILLCFIPIFFWIKNEKEFSSSYYVIRDWIETKMQVHYFNDKYIFASTSGSDMLVIPYSDAIILHKKP